MQQTRDYGGIVPVLHFCPILVAICIFANGLHGGLTELNAPATTKDMATFTKTLEMRTSGRGMHEFTAEVEAGLRTSGLSEGTVTIFCRHTSCSLVIMENADPSAQADLEQFMERLAPEE